MPVDGPAAVMQKFIVFCPFADGKIKSAGQRRIKTRVCINKTGHYYAAACIDKLRTRIF